MSSNNSGPTPDQDSDDAGRPRGADLAREALAAAKARNAARRAQEPTEFKALRRRRTRWSGAGPDTRDPAPFGLLAKRWVKEHGSSADLAKATVVANWATVVGPDLAAHCTPVDLVDGTLTVRAETTAWATQIRMLAPTVLARIAATVGANEVRQLRTTGPVGPSWRFGPRHVSGRGPRDTYG